MDKLVDKWLLPEYEDRFRLQYEGTEHGLSSI